MNWFRDGINFKKSNQNKPQLKKALMPISKAEDMKPGKVIISRGSSMARNWSDFRSRNRALKRLFVKYFDKGMPPEEIMEKLGLNAPSYRVWKFFYLRAKKGIFSKNGFWAKYAKSSQPDTNIADLFDKLQSGIDALDAKLDALLKESAEVSPKELDNLRAVNDFIWEKYREETK